MDIEFHYYIVYLIAARAGFEPSDSYKIAYSSQFVDNNVISYKINSKTSEAYKNHISQTCNILKPNKKLFRIYPLFHFIPGNVLKGDNRKDGKLHYLNTTPGSENAEKIFDAALNSKNLYRIGIACHAYADTWSHQNYTGYLEEFNAKKEGPMTGLFHAFRYIWGWRLIGHAGFDHKPDKVNGEWNDCRLLRTKEKRNNNTIFLEATGKIFEKLYKAKYPDFSNEDMVAEKENLLMDIRKAIKDESPDQRRKNYRELSMQEVYGKEKIREYDSYEWMSEAIYEDMRSFKTKGKHIVIKFFLNWVSNTFSWFNEYSWKNPEMYTETNWFQFQEAVKEHQKIATEILDETNIGQLKLTNW